MATSTIFREQVQDLLETTGGGHLARDILGRRETRAVRLESNESRRALRPRFMRPTSNAFRNPRGAIAREICRQAGAEAHRAARIAKAKAILMRTRNMSDEEVYNLIRDLTMSKRITTDEIADAVIKANEILSDLMSSPEG